MRKPSSQRTVDFNLLKKKAKDLLYMLWLRPEVVVWRTAEYRLVSDRLLGGGNVLEIGIGNGYNSFMLLNGKFKDEYDWFYNIETDACKRRKDMYDALKVSNVKDYVETRPDKMLRIAMDHKRNLLKQVAQLDFVDKLVMADVNKSLVFEGIDTVFSNMLYWLKDPFRALRSAASQLGLGGELIFGFPNSDFFKYCCSYSSGSPMWRLLNLGRAGHIMWHMDMVEFERELRRKAGAFTVVDFKRYLSKETLRVWDIGLRPLSPHLAGLANSVTPERRLEVKREWCDTCEPLVYSLLETELERGSRRGGYNFVVLEKTKD